MKQQPSSVLLLLNMINAIYELISSAETRGNAWVQYSDREEIDPVMVCGPGRGWSPYTAWKEPHMRSSSTVTYCRPVERHCRDPLLYIYCFKFCCILNWVYSNMSCVNKSAAAAAWRMLGMLASFSCGFWDGGFVSISCSISYKHCGSQYGVAQLFSVLLGDCTSDHWQPVITVV